MDVSRADRVCSGLQVAFVEGPSAWPTVVVAALLEPCCAEALDRRSCRSHRSMKLTVATSDPASPSPLTSITTTPPAAPAAISLPGSRQLQV